MQPFAPAKLTLWGRSRGRYGGLFLYMESDEWPRSNNFSIKKYRKCLKIALLPIGVWYFTVCALAGVKYGKKAPWIIRASIERLMFELTD